MSAYPYLASVLQQLAAREVRLGIICSTPAVSAESLSAALAAAGINAFFDQDLLIFAGDGVEREPRASFYLAAGRAGLQSSPGSCLLVSEDSVARGQALAAGWRVAPHPLLTQAVLEGDALWFVRITVPPHRAAEEWRVALRGLALVPLRVSGEGGRTVLAIASGTALAELANAQFDVQPLGQEGDPASSDLYVIRDDEAAGSGFLSGSGQFEQLFGQGNSANQGLLLSASDEGILIRVPSERSIEEFHFATAAHGHNLKLVPDPGLLGSEADWRGQSRFEALAAERDLTPAEAALIGQLTDARIQAFLDRYAGNAPLGDAPGTAVDSRHILHAGNQRVTNQLAADLQAIGGSALTVSTHSFTHNGRSYSNVEAELAGNTSELVLVTAHLDSTAASSPPYNPAGDPAPGADDDGSGLAAVLAAAEVHLRPGGGAKAGADHPLRAVQRGRARPGGQPGLCTRRPGRGRRDRSRVPDGHDRLQRRGAAHLRGPRRLPRLTRRADQVDRRGGAGTAPGPRRRAGPRHDAALPEQPGSGRSRRRAQRISSIIREVKAYMWESCHSQRKRA